MFLESCILQNDEHAGVTSKHYKKWVHVLDDMRTITLVKNAKVKRIKKKKNTENPDIIFIRNSDTLLFISHFNKTVHFVHFITKSNKVLIKVKKNKNI